MKTLLGMSSPGSTTLRGDLGLVVLRVTLGIVMIAHGWQKLHDNGLSGTTAGFDAMGIPLPDAAAVFAIAVELGGGVLLVLGAFTPVVGLLVAANMAGAFWYVHRDAFFAMDGGYEYVMTLALMGVALAFTGAGRLSVDRYLAGAPSAAAGSHSTEREPALTR